MSQDDVDSDMVLPNAALCWGGLRKGMMATAVLSGRKLSPSSCPDARNFSSSPYATGALQGAALVLEPRGSEE